MGQSIDMPSIQSCKYCRFLSGMNLHSSESSFNLSRICVCLTYHSFSRIISIGFPPLSLTGTSCKRSSVESRFPDERSISIALLLASITFIPDNGPEISVISPLRLIATNGLIPSSLNIETSFWSPNEHTIRIPLPNSIFTDGWAAISTYWSLSTVSIGSLTLLPSRCWYLSSSGFTTIIPQAQIISGLVVEIMISSPHSVYHFTWQSFASLWTL